MAEIILVIMALLIIRVVGLYNIIIMAAGITFAGVIIYTIGLIALVTSGA